MVQAVVRADGTVREVHVIGGHPMLAAAAERAVMKWRYRLEKRKPAKPCASPSALSSVPRSICGARRCSLSCRLVTLDKFANTDRIRFPVAMAGDGVGPSRRIDESPTNHTCLVGTDAT